MWRNPVRIASLSLLGFVIAFSAGPLSASVIQHQLDQTLPEVRFDGVAINDAIDFLRDVSGANISVNWKSLSEQGITRESPITMRLRQVTLRKALSLMLSEVGGGDKLGFGVDEGVIEISSREMIDSRMYTRVYPIEDLIMVIPDFTDAPDFSLTSQSSGSSAGGSSGSSGSGGLFSGSSQSASKAPEKSKTERANDLIELIRSVIQPGVWVENGGKAAIRYWNGNLVVTAPRSVLEAIGGSFD